MATTTMKYWFLSSTIIFIKSVAAYYCDNDLCKEGEYCCGNNICCASYTVWELWYFWFGIVLLIVLYMSQCLFRGDNHVLHHWFNSIGLDGVLKNKNAVKGFGIVLLIVLFCMCICLWKSRYRDRRILMAYSLMSSKQQQANIGSRFSDTLQDDMKQLQGKYHHLQQNAPPTYDEAIHEYKGPLIK